MRRALPALVLIAAASLAACAGSSSSPTSSAPATAAPSAISGTVVVSAAASLTEAFTTIAQQFEKAHPGVRVILNFAGSDSLASQITAGAPVDVFAAASTKTMGTVTAAKDAVAAPVTFARNQLEIATAPGNPSGITSLADTTKPGVTLVLCAAAVPCGAAATKAYAAGKLTPKPVSLEQDVKSVLTKVELKEADAGLVYETDVKAAGAKVAGVRFAEAAQAIATYPIVGVKSGKNAAGGTAFIAAVLSAPGTAVLQQAGFRKP